MISVRPLQEHERADAFGTCHSGTTLCPRIAREESHLRDYLARLPERIRQVQAATEADFKGCGVRVDRNDNTVVNESPQDTHYTPRYMVWGCTVLGFGGAPRHPALVPLGTETLRSI